MGLSFSDDNEQLHVVHYAHGGTGGGSAVAPKPIVDGDIIALPAGFVVSGVDVIVTAAVTGTTQIDVGDDDDQNGFVAAATLTLNALSVGAGAYLASGAKKFYPAAGKELKLDVAGASSAGAFKVVLKGYKVAL